MRFWSLLPAAVRYVNCRERCATVFNGHRCGVPERSLGRANHVRWLNIARSTMPGSHGFSACSIAR
jgi:hypothetical protein